MISTTHIFVSWSDARGRHHCEVVSEAAAETLAGLAREARKQRVEVYRVTRYVVPELPTVLFQEAMASIKAPAVPLRGAA